MNITLDINDRQAMALAVAQIKDEGQRQKVVDAVKKKNLDETATRALVDKFLAVGREEKKEEQAKAEKKIDRSHPIHVILDEVEDNEVLIRLKDEDERDRFNTALQKYIRSIKLEMDRL